jgi:hypothetical protein
MQWCQNRTHDDEKPYECMDRQQSILVCEAGNAFHQQLIMHHVLFVDRATTLATSSPGKAFH